MRLRGIAIAIVIIFLTGVVLAAIVIQKKESTEIDIVAINGIAKTIEGNWEQIERGDYSSIEEPFSDESFFKELFSVIDSYEAIVYQSEYRPDVTIHEAIRSRDTVVDLMVDDGYVGKLIIHHQDIALVQRMKLQLMSILLATFVVLAILSIVYMVYINRSVIRPFKQLQSFAAQVARGNLDIPLVMDKHNRFGAFTESFDLMREELAAARQREYEANRSKKELVASLSHDIKTPVASIKAVTELMLAMATDQKAIKQLNTIHAKTEQINLLVTDMFHATLEELQQLKVTITEESSEVLRDMIENVNLDHQISQEQIPDCIILVDGTRLQQVLDNVLSNSYKYAGTPVRIVSRISHTHLELHIMDYGKGIDEDELPLIFNKFYRGKNVEGKSGSGLGLYISQYFMQNMQGDIEAHNRPDGFTVIIKIKLA